jgi:hypothetical protein
MVAEAVGITLLVLAGIAGAVVLIGAVGALISSAWSH